MSCNKATAYNGALYNFVEVFAPFTGTAVNFAACLARAILP